MPAQIGPGADPVTTSSGPPCLFGLQQRLPLLRLRQRRQQRLPARHAGHRGQGIDDLLQPAMFELGLQRSQRHLGTACGHFVGLARQDGVEDVAHVRVPRSAAQRRQSKQASQLA